MTDGTLQVMTRDPRFRLLPALLIGVLLLALAPRADAHPRGRRPYFGYAPGYDWRWGPSGYWGPGIDHPYYQPWIPFAERRRNTPGSRFERWMDEGVEAFRRGELKVARHRFEEARDLATERWGPESKQALQAARALDNLRAPEPEPPASAPPDPPPPPEPAVQPAARPLPTPSPKVAGTLAEIRARLEVARRARERSPGAR
jgi:hypothetical protein